MKKFLLSSVCALVLLAGAPAHATTYYFADNGAGSVAACTTHVGNNANAGTDPAAPKRNFAGWNWNALASVGDRVYLAYGCAWDDISIVFEGRATRDPASTNYSDFILGAYTHPSIASSVKPVLHNNTGTGIIFGGYGETDQSDGDPPVACSLPTTGFCDGGYTFENFTLDGPHVITGPDGPSCVQFGNTVHHVLFSNVEVRECRIGFLIPSTEPDNGLAGIHHIIIRNSHIHTHYEHGIIGGAHDLVLENNHIERNNSYGPDAGTGQEHGLYLTSGNRMVVRANWFDRNSLVDGVCSGGNMTFHGHANWLLIENNLIEQDSIGGSCYGFSITPGYLSTPEYARNLVMRGNRVKSVGAAFCLNIAPGAVIENNIVIDSTTGFVVDCNSREADDDVMSAYKMRNNTVYYSSGFGTGTGFDLGSTATTSGIEFTNNLVVFAGSTGTRTGFGYDTTNATYTVRNYNQCWGCSRWQDATTDTLAEAQAGGYDTNSTEANPSIQNVPSAGNGFQVKPTAFVNGTASYAARTSIFGWLRGSPPKIGAYDVNNP